MKTFKCWFLDGDVEDVQEVEAFGPSQAAEEFVENNYYYYGDSYEIGVIDPDGKKWNVTVDVENEPHFYGHATPAD